MVMPRLRALLAFVFVLSSNGAKAAAAEAQGSVPLSMGIDSPAHSFLNPASIGGREFSTQAHRKLLWFEKAEPPPPPPPTYIIIPNSSPASTSDVAVGSCV